MSNVDDSPAASLTTRIKRNSACTSCRDAKVRCNPSQRPEQPCQRCGKLNLECVVDKTHKRVSRKSKIDELVQEIQTIKQTVGGQLPQRRSTPSKEPVISRPSMPSPVMRPPIPPSNPTVVSLTHTPATTLIGDPNVEPSLPRALGSQPFSGEDIDYYFQKYFEHFHPYMPIVRCRDPNKCYEAGSVLFWTIILVACRRFARNSLVLTFLMDAVKKEILSAISNMPLSIHSINALILGCTWPFADARFISDPASMFSGVAMNASLLLGIHTGKGSHREFGWAAFKNNFSNEEAAYTWAGYNILAQRLSVYMGMPPGGVMFNQTVQNLIDGKPPFQVPPNFRVLLECQKFSNHVSKTMGICMDGAQGVSPHIVKGLEEEYNAIRRLICSEHADDLDLFNILMIKQEIQTYYMLPLPGYNSDELKRNVLRAYTTARTVVHQALDLDNRYNFLQYLPHFYFRGIFSASSILFKVLRSSYRDLVDKTQMEEATSAVLSICHRCAVRDGDLPTRMASLLDSFWEVSKTSKWNEEPVSECHDRLGASVDFDCLLGWKAVMNEARPRSQPQPAEGDEAAAVLIAPDPLVNIDWSFMDDFGGDFDWNIEPALLSQVS